MLFLWLVILLFGLIFLFLIKRYNYWSSRGVDTPNYHYVVGNLLEQFTTKKNYGVIISDAYKKFKGYNYVGFYSVLQPTILALTPEVIGSVLVRDFQSFGDNDFDIDERADPIFGKNPFILKGERWRTVRAQVTPSFTTGRVKMMLPLILDNSRKLLRFMAENSTKQPMDAKLLSTRITTENVASCAFGIDGANFTDDSRFLQIWQQLISPSTWNTIKGFILFLVPQLARVFKMRFFQRDTVDFLTSVLQQSIAHRKEQGIQRNDFIDEMTRLREKIDDESVFNFADILAHAGGFMLDGVETSANVISFALYELAAHQGVQEKLRAEIERVLAKHNGEITYEALSEMEYLECVFKENLRLNPPIFFMAKRVTKPYTLPSMREGGGGPCVTLEVGTPVLIPMHAVHRDAEYFPDAEQFKPERFDAANKDSIEKFTYFPFGDGPRVCLGMKFGVLQSKVALVTLVKHFRITVNAKTQQPIQIDPMNFINSPVGGFWLDFAPLS